MTPADLPVELFMGAIVYIMGWSVLLGSAGFLVLARVGKGVLGVILAVALGPIGLFIAWTLRENAYRDQEERARRHQGRVPTLDVTPALTGAIAIAVSTIALLGVSAGGFYLYMQWANAQVAAIRSL